MDIHVASLPHDVDETSPANFPGDELRGQSQIVKDRAQRAGGFGELSFLVENVPSDRDDGSIHVDGPCRHHPELANPRSRASGLRPRMDCRCIRNAGWRWRTVSGKDGPTPTA